MTMIDSVVYYMSMCMCWMLHTCRSEALKGKAGQVGYDMGVFVRGIIWTDFDPCSSRRVLIHVRGTAYHVCNVSTRLAISLDRTFHQCVWCFQLLKTIFFHPVFHHPVLKLSPALINNGRCWSWFYWCFIWSFWNLPSTMLLSSQKWFCHD